MAVRTEERNQFLADVFITAIEGGVNYWARVSDYKWKGCESDGRFSAVLNDSEGADFVDRVVDITVIDKGIDAFLAWIDTRNLGPDHYYRKFVIANLTDGVDGDFDAQVADMIVQFGLFGEVVYG